MDVGEACCGEEPESRAVLPSDNGVFEEEGFWVERDVLLGRDVIVEEGIEEAAEEHEDGEGPVPHVGPVARQADDGREKYDVPAYGPIVLGM